MTTTLPPDVHTPDDIRAGRVMSSQCMFDQSLQIERDLGLNQWEAACPTVDGIGQCASIITKVSTSDNGLDTGVLLQLNGWDITMEKGVGFY